MKYLISLITIIFCTQNSQATSIIPFEDIGALSMVVSDIYVATAGSTDTIRENGEIRFSQSFNIISHIKGERQSTFDITKLSRWSDGLYMSVSGEIDFEEGKKYLLFLRNRGRDNNLYPACSSYYIYEIDKLNNVEYAVPLYENGSVHIVSDNTSSQKAHHIFDLKKLSLLIKKHLALKSSWNQSAAIADQKVVVEFKRKLKINPPSYCGYISDNNTSNHARWRYMETQSVPVYFQLNGDNCNNIAGEIQNTINYVNNSYPGVNFGNPSSRTGYSSCTGGQAYRGLPNYMNNTFGDTRRVYIQFSDPCNEIPGLVNCAGTLGYGGSYWGSTYNANGQTYSESSVGFVVINEGVTNCYCGNTSPGKSQTNFAIFLAHELTHVLGLNHISPSAGSALINPSCCNEVSSLDLACMGDLYQASGPQCTHTNRTYNNTTIGNTQVRADNNVRTINTVTIQNGANVIWNAENIIEINGPFQIPQGATLTTSIDECQ